MARHKFEYSPEIKRERESERERVDIFFLLFHSQHEAYATRGVKESIQRRNRMKERDRERQTAQRRKELKGKVVFLTAIWFLHVKVQMLEAIPLGNVTCIVVGYSTLKFRFCN